MKQERSTKYNPANQPSSISFLELMEQLTGEPYSHDKKQKIKHIFDQLKDYPDYKGLFIEVGEYQDSIVSRIGYCHSENNHEILYMCPGFDTIEQAYEAGKIQAKLIHLGIDLAKRIEDE